MELLKIFCLVIKADISGIEIGFDVSIKFIGASSVNEGMFKGGRDKCAVRLVVDDEPLPKTDGGLLHGTVGRHICLFPSSFSLFREWGGFSMRSSVVLDVESSGARNTSELQIRARFDGMGVSSSEFSMSLSSISRNRRQYRKLLLKDARANRLSIITLNISSFSKKRLFNNRRWTIYIETKQNV